MYMKHAGGRPSKYDPSFVEEIDKYLETTGREQTKLPTIYGFAIWLGVDTDTLNNWANAKVKDADGNNTDELLYPEFFGALKRLKDLQAEQLVNDGIYGGKEVNATIVKLLLQNNHGMKERVDQTTNDKDTSPVLVKFIENENDRDSNRV